MFHTIIQEDVMKTSTAVAVGLLLIAAVPMMGQGNGAGDRVGYPYFPSVSRYGESDVQKAKRLYLLSIRSANCGVAESALAHLTHMRLALFQEDMSDVEVALLDLAKDGSTHAIRVKAFLARHVFWNPGAFRDILSREFASGDELFEAIADRLNPAI